MCVEVNHRWKRQKSSNNDRRHADRTNVRVNHCERLQEPGMGVRINASQEHGSLRKGENNHE